VFAGQNVGVTQVGERIWLVTFMHYDLGYFDDETCRLEPIENPFGPKLYRNEVLPIDPEWTHRRLARRTGRFPQLVDSTSGVESAVGAVIHRRSARRACSGGAARPSVKRAEERVRVFEPEQKADPCAAHASVLRRAGSSARLVA
jgi:hypothetical protein